MNMHFFLRLLTHFNLNLIIPFVILLKFIKVATALTVFKSLLLGLGIISVVTIILLSYKKSPWVIICLIHGLLFVCIDLIRFVTFKDRMDYFFIRYEFFDCVMALISITSILNRANNKWVQGVTICCHYIVMLIAVKNKDMWLLLYAVTDVMTIIAASMVRDIDKRALYDRIVKEIKQEIICYACNKITDKLTLEKVISVVKSLSIESLIDGTNSLIVFMTAKSEKSTIEYLEDTNNLLSWIKKWISGTIPPENVQLFLTVIVKLPIFCSSVLTLLVIDPYITPQTGFVLLILIGSEYYFLFNKFEMSTDYLMKSQECINGKLDTVILSVNVVKSGVETINVTIETVTNGINSTIEFTTNLTHSIYSNFVSGAENVVEYSKAHPYKVGFIGFLPLIGIAGYVGYNRYNDKKN